MNTRHTGRAVGVGVCESVGTCVEVPTFRTVGVGSSVGRTVAEAVAVGTGVSLGVGVGVSVPRASAVCVPNASR